MSIFHFHWWPFPCLDPVRLFPRSSRSIHFGDVSETNGFSPGPRDPKRLYRDEIRRPRKLGKPFPCFKQETRVRFTRFLSFNPILSRSCLSPQPKWRNLPMKVLFLTHMYYKKPLWSTISLYRIVNSKLRFSRRSLLKSMSHANMDPSNFPTDLFLLLYLLACNYKIGAMGMRPPWTFPIKAFGIL